MSSRNGFALWLPLLRLRDARRHHKESLMNQVQSLRPKEYFHDKSTRDMAKHLASVDRSMKQNLAYACRILAMTGQEAGLAGQISARSERPGAYWTLRFGLGFDEAKPDDFIEVNGPSRAWSLALLQNGSFKSPFSVPATPRTARPARAPAPPRSSAPTCSLLRRRLRCTIGAATVPLTMAMSACPSIESRLIGLRASRVSAGTHRRAC